MAADPIAQVERTQVLIERAPVAFTAAVFAVAFLAALVALLRARDKAELAIRRLNDAHAKELAGVNADRLRMAIDQTSLFTRVLVALEELEPWLRAKGGRGRSKELASGD